MVMMGTSCSTVYGKFLPSEITETIQLNANFRLTLTQKTGHGESRQEFKATNSTLSVER